MLRKSGAQWRRSVAAGAAVTTLLSVVERDRHRHPSERRIVRCLLGYGRHHQRLRGHECPSRRG